jgi:hypothetical protein
MNKFLLSLTLIALLANVRAGQAAPPPAQEPRLREGAPRPAQPPAAAAARAAKLNADLKTFTLRIVYIGDEEKPYYRLLLSVPVLPGKDRDNPFFQQARINQAQAGCIVERLAKDGCLDTALDGNRDRGPVPPKEPYYALVVRVEHGGDPSQFEEWLRLDSPLLYQRLDGLRQALDGDAARGLDLLIERLSGHRMAVQRTSAQPAATPPVDEQAVADLIRLLGDDRFAVREDATRKLIAMGKAIHPVLRARLQAAGLDAEIANRIRTVLDFRPPDPAARRSVTDPASGMTFTLSDDGAEVSATAGQKMMWRVRLAAPAAGLQLDGQFLVVLPQNAKYDLASGKCVWDPMPR